MRYNVENVDLPEGLYAGILPLHFIAEQNATVKLNIGNLEYSYDNNVYQTYTKNSEIPLQAGQRVYFKGNNTNIYATTKNTSLCTISGGLVGCYGRISSLYSPMYFTDVKIVPKTVNSQNSAAGSSLSGGYPNEELCQFFYAQTLLTHSPSFEGLTYDSISGNILGSFCEGCTNLRELEDLSIFTFAGQHHNIGNYWFSKCASLTNLNAKPNEVITLMLDNSAGGATNCFSYCTSLTDVSCFRIGGNNWQVGEDMFGHSGIINGPEIFLTGGGSWSLTGLLENCTSLQNFKITDTTWRSGRQEWVKGVPGEQVTVYKNPALSSTFGDSYLPTGCTVIDLE